MINVKTTILIKYLIFAIKFTIKYKFFIFKKIRNCIFFIFYELIYNFLYFQDVEIMNYQINVELHRIVLKLLISIYAIDNLILKYGKIKKLIPWNKKLSFISNLKVFFNNLYFFYLKIVVVVRPNLVLRWRNKIDFNIFNKSFANIKMSLIYYIWIFMIKYHL